MGQHVELFKALLSQVDRLPFAEREAVWSELSFAVNDYGKRFPQTAIKIFSELFLILEREARFDIRGANILEIGPGYSMGLGFLAALSGAAKACAVDIYTHPRGADHDFIAAMYAKLIEERSFLPGEAHALGDKEFTERFAGVVSRDADSRFCYRPDRVALLFPHPVTAMPFEDSAFDLVYTSAAFEHFMEPRDAVREMARVTKPGGLHLHSVDLRDHRNFRRPLDHLTVDDAEWKVFYEESKSASYIATNRLRVSEITALFESSGFETVSILPVPFMRCTLKDDLFDRFLPRYQALSREELSLLSCRFVFRKR